MTQDALAAIGHNGLIIVTAALIAAGALHLWALFQSEKRLHTWAHRLQLGGWILTSGAVLLLVGLFLADAFAFSYVAGRSSREMAAFYKVTALWAGQEGSLLFWLWLQSGFGLVVGRRALAGRALDRGAAGVLALIASFFAILVAFVVDPFALNLPGPADGAGMNPILQSYWMTMHPVMLYLGYVGLSVPFAYAAASLMTPDDAWVRVTRRWTLIAWTFLSIGILFGARWAYEELGWGGYWGWDPVENASFMPWLVATAFVHSGIIQEKRGMLKRWNHALVFVTYFLTIFGTFVTRSGILSSVHAFVESDISPWFIGYAGIFSAFFLWGLIQRWPELEDERRIESPLSKESSFLANNVVLLATAFTIFWGTVFPLVASALGTQVTVGTPYFDRVTGPLFWALIVLMGIGPIISWRRASGRHLKRHFTAPVLNGFFMAVWLWLMGFRDVVTILAVPAAVFVATTILMEFARAAGVRSRSRREPLWLALPRVMNKNPGRYGGYLVHFGVLVIAVGIAVSQVYQVEENVVLGVGETASIGPYRLTLFGIDETLHGGVPAVEASLLLEDRGGPLGYLRPSKRFYPTADPDLGPTTETAIYGSVKGDMYAVLAGWEPFGSLVGFKFFYNPMVWLIWAGGALLVFGALFSLWPRAERVFSESERALASLAELEYDYQMGKVTQGEYQALRRELLPKASRYVEQEERAVRRVLAEVKRRLDKSARRRSAGLLPVLLACTMTLAALSGPSVAAQGRAEALQSAGATTATTTDATVGTPNDATAGATTDTSTGSTTGTPSAMPAAVVVPQETVVLRLHQGRLKVLDLVSVRNLGDEPVKLRLPVPSGAVWGSSDPEGLELSDGAVVDPDPLAPGQEKRYTLRYEIPVVRWPYGFSREVAHPTQTLQLFVLPDEIRVRGLDLRDIGLQQLAGQTLRVFESAWLGPGVVWQAILTPGEAVGPAAGWDPRIETLPVLGEADRFPGEWLLRRAGRDPAFAGGLIGFAVLVLLGIAWARFGPGRARFVSPEGGAEERALGPDQPRPEVDGSPGERVGEGAPALRLESLAKTIARLDLAHAEGTLAEGVYRRRRRGLMNRLVKEASALGKEAEGVLTKASAAEERGVGPESLGRG